MISFRFNPLTRIRPFLTEKEEAIRIIEHAAFQSPHGDSSFSDNVISLPYLDINGIMFQPPHGDSFFSDIAKFDTMAEGMVAVSKFQSPHGDLFFSDGKVVSFDTMAAAIVFQSPHEDSLSSDLRNCL